MTGETTRCGFVALLGAPNAGKSTLVNRLVGTKVAIVSPKVQTTRSRVTGILVESGAQAVFLDLPGVFAPKRRLDRAMVDAAWRGAEDADALLFVVDAKRASRGSDDDEALILDGLRERKLKAVLVLNKIDLLDPPTLLTLAKRYDATGLVSEIFMVSAETGDGCDTLKEKLLGRLPEGPYLYPEDEISDLPARLLAAEATREQVFRQLHQELPYAIAVETDKFEERKDGSARIEQTVYVAREGQRKIVIGAKGAQIKKIGEMARAEIARMLDRPIHLFLHVKVAPDWDEKRDFFKDWGLEYDA
ncbi:MAG: GTPase Era [Rhodospirillales bacterium]|nr:GTPase Era [Rhodospirillales bacterium]